MKKQRPFATPTEPGFLRRRIETALAEHRYQNALELARQQYKYEPTPEHGDLLLRAQFGRAQQLRLDGKTRDAAAILQSALNTHNLSPEWKTKLAAELAGAGDSVSAMKLAAAAGPEVEAKILALAVDAAVEREQAGKASLHPDLHADFDRIQLAFRQQAAGQNDAVRETLQAIGLRSPFLEWKLLLRGLLAYYQNDDTRALENWQRLDPARIPSRLIAPYRATIDPAYRSAQSAAARNQLDRQFRRLQGDGPADLLRSVMKNLRHGSSMAQAFRAAEQAVSVLRRDAPHVVQRLARCLYWAVVENGQPEDIPRYQRVFGPPSDDPSFTRLSALGLERRSCRDLAHDYWQRFDQDVSRHPAAWPGDEAVRVRALIWQHMGHNAESEFDPNDLEDDDDGPVFGRYKPKALKPDAETCYRKAIALAPDYLDAYFDLFRHLVGRMEVAKAIDAGRQLLARFPDHFETMNMVGAMLMEAQQYPEALAMLQQALQKNPLDRNLRKRVAAAHTYNARSHAEAGRFDEARQEYQSSLAMNPETRDAVLSKWAACEFKAGDAARAEELLQQAMADSGSHLATMYSVLIEAIRLGLPGPLKTRFNKAFNQGLAEAPTAAAAVALADTTAGYHLAGVTYHGQKTHQKKVLDYLKKASRENFSERQMEAICEALVNLDSYRLAQTYTQLAKKKFKTNPLLFVLAAENELHRQTRIGTYDARRDLEQARTLAQALPPGREREDLLERINSHQQHLDSLNPFYYMFGGPPRFDDYGDDDDDSDGFF